MSGRSWSVPILGVTQVISWGILYYAFGVMAPAIRADLGVSPAQLYGAFSWAVLVAGLAALPVGVLIDRHGGRRVMAAGSLVAGTGMLVLGASRGLAAYYFAWSVIGLGMAMTLYDAAFATLNRSLRESSRRAISNVTLAGGLASTAFWPLTAWLLARQDWRDTCFAFAALLLAVCAPLHCLLDDGAPRTVTGTATAAAQDQGHDSLRQAMARPLFWRLAAVFATQAFVFSALSVHMVPLIRKIGHPEHLAVALAAAIGPMQVIGRLAERTLAARASPQRVAAWTFAALPLALLVLYTLGASVGAVAVFCVLYGMSNGVLTILRGTLPQALFGHTHYGAIAGALAAPSLLAKAGAPVLLALFLEEGGGGGGYRTLLGGLFLLALAAFALFRYRPCLSSSG